MEIKGEENGVLVVEDFAHHPTAIRMNLEATRTRWPGQKIWAVVEPRTNTMRRKIFQDVLPDALALADVVLIGPVNRAQLLEDDERLSPETIAGLIQERGRPAKAFAATDEIVDYLSERAKPRDVVMIMSNGSFDGLSGKLLAALKSQVAARR
jgi:UDP-N-acetylmuramate: L-alanyl-gamma-D-glutamyl-meso-diaminopimelate ligase